MSGDSSEAKQFVIVADARRRWTRAQKQAIVAECEGASVSAVARKHNIAPNLLFRWRKDFGEEPRAVLKKPAFVPVALPALPSLSATPDVAMPAIKSVVEIELANGRLLRVDSSIDASALRRVIALLEER